MVPDDPAAGHRAAGHAAERRASGVAAGADARGAVDAELVRRVAHLARLGLPPSEMEAASRELDSVLGHFRALQAVDTTGVEPLVHALEAPGVPQRDAVAAFPDPRAALLPLTAHAREGLFVVPRVFEADFGVEPGPVGRPQADVEPRAG